jgi:hypothetical protein
LPEVIDEDLTEEIDEVDPVLDAISKPKKKYEPIRGKKIAELAKNILYNDRKNKVEEKAKEKFPEIEVPEQETIEKKPDAVEIKQGYSPETAFIIKDRREIEHILNAIFFRKTDEGIVLDGTYFICNEVKVCRRGKCFTTIYVEDCNGYRYQFWFDITNTGLLANLVVTRPF